MEGVGNGTPLKGNNRCFNASTAGNYEKGTSEIIITEIAE